MSDTEKNPKSSRKWLLTINNPLDHGMDHEQIKLNLSLLENLKYWCMCDEEGDECETLHTHVFICRSGHIRFDTIKKLFPSAHIDKPYGTAIDNRNYIGKFKDEHHKTVDGSYDYIDEKGKRHAGINYGDTFEEFGTCPEEHQGKRTDIADMYQLIKDGASDYEIFEENPKYIKYLEKIGKVRETIMFEQFKNKRREDLKVEYWYGDPGTGKTSGILNMYGDDKVYIVSNYQHPWDDYKGQDVVLFDDFDSHRIITNDLLRWLDIYPITLPARYGDKVACFTKVYITSNYSPEDLWRDEYRWNDKLYSALMRRIHVVKKISGRGKVTVEKENGFLTVSPEEAARLDTMFGNGGN